MAFLRFLRAHNPKKIWNYRYIKDVFGEECCSEVCWETDVGSQVRPQLIEERALCPLTSAHTSFFFIFSATQKGDKNSSDSQSG